VPHEQTTFSFARRRDPVFRAMKRQLELVPAGRGEPFVEELPGTREERASRTVGVLYVPTRFLGALTRTGWRLRRLDEELHHGRIT